MAPARPHRLYTQRLRSILSSILSYSRLAASEDHHSFCWPSFLRFVSHWESVPRLQTVSFAREVALLEYSESW